MYITAVEKVLLFIDFFFSSSSITRDPVSMSLSAALTVGKLSPSFLVSSIPASLIKLNYEFIYSILYISNFYIFITLYILYYIYIILLHNTLYIYL